MAREASSLLSLLTHVSSPILALWVNWMGLRGGEDGKSWRATPPPYRIPLPGFPVKSVILPLARDSVRPRILDGPVSPSTRSTRHLTLRIRVTFVHLRLIFTHHAVIVVCIASIDLRGGRRPYLHEQHRQKDQAVSGSQDHEGQVEAEVIHLIEQVIGMGIIISVREGGGRRGEGGKETRGCCQPLMR